MLHKLTFNFWYCAWLWIYIVLYLSIYIFIYFWWLIIPVNICALTISPSLLKIENRRNGVQNQNSCWDVKHGGVLPIYQKDFEKDFWYVISRTLQKNKNKNKKQLFCIKHINIKQNNFKASFKTFQTCFEVTEPDISFHLLFHSALLWPLRKLQLQRGSLL